MLIKIWRDMEQAIITFDEMFIKEESKRRAAILEREVKQFLDEHNLSERDIDMVIVEMRHDGIYKIRLKEKQEQEETPTLDLFFHSMGW